MILVVISVAGRIPTVVGVVKICFDTSEKIRNINPCDEATCRKECKENNPHVVRTFAHCTVVGRHIDGIPCSCKYDC
ncbi:hypothetical protein M5689_007328 [Euphorbia peplus]|nr:hypothetical protein M5689_007328 [Euphorbia peplus]